MVQRIRNSAIYKQAIKNGMPKEEGPEFAGKCYKIARELCYILELNYGQVFLNQLLDDEVAAIRILDYYIPISLWLIYQIDLGRKDGKEGPVVVGVSIPQGGGKTTMTNCLEAALKVIDLKTVVVSYDDFYLTYKDQQALAKKYPHNKYLQGRGVAGTHDL